MTKNCSLYRNSSRDDGLWSLRKQWGFCTSRICGTTTIVSHRWIHKEDRNWTIMLLFALNRQQHFPVSLLLTLRIKCHIEPIMLYNTNPQSRNPCVNKCYHHFTIEISFYLYLKQHRTFRIQGNIQPCETALTCSSYMQKYRTQECKRERSHITTNNHTITSEI